MLLRMIFVILVGLGVGIVPLFVKGETLHRLAKRYAEQNDVQKADTHFSLALKNAAIEEVAAIVPDYAAFLMKIGDMHKAELLLRQAHAQWPHDKKIKKLLARSLILQEKVIEGLRHLKTLHSETEALEEIAAIYREQGNGEMLAAVEQKWNMKPSDPLRSEYPYMASARTPVLPGKEVRPISRQVSHSHPALVPVARPSRGTAIVPEGQVSIPTGLEKIDTDVSVPFPNSASQLPLAVGFPNPADQKYPLPLPKASHELEKLALVNPIKLLAPPDVVPSTEQYPPRPTVAPRSSFYSDMVNADAFDHLEVSYPIKQATAIVPVK